METVILFAVCLALFVVQIVLLVKAIKSKEKKYWISEFCVEFFSIILYIGLLYYYWNLPRGGFMPGLHYISEELICFGAVIIYTVMICVNIIAKLIVFTKNQKEQGEKSAVPLILSAFFVLVIAVIAVLYIRI